MSNLYTNLSEVCCALTLSLFKGLGFFVFLLLCSCKENNSNSKTLFQKLDPSQTHINFSNDLFYDSKFNIFTYRHFYNGGGVAIGDINNDGLPDLFFTANMLPNRLFLNKGNMEFEDISDKAGIVKKGKWSTGVSMVDVNGDGFLDIYVCN
ncbi:MAG TPA: VCBS repeat-containing protein, partial [Segetibacter sp.]